MITIEIIKEEKELLQEKLSQNKKELAKSPSGNLIVLNRGNSLNFSRQIWKEGKRTAKAITKDPVMTKRLARKAYLEKENYYIEQNINALDRMINHYHEDTSICAFDSLRDSLKMLPLDYYKKTDSFVCIKPEWQDALFNGMGWRVPLEGDKVLHPDTELILRLQQTAEGRALLREEDFRKAWMNSNYRQYKGYPEYLIHPTMHGMVRSKSEQMIVNLADSLGLTFHYEEVLDPSYGECFYTPDFTFLRWDGKFFFLEHFGLMTNERYREERLRKLAAYEKVGIVPWDNLIETFDSEDGTLNIREVEAIFRSKLLP